MFRLAFFTLFVLAVVTLSRLVSAFDGLLAAGPSDQTVGALLLWLVALLAVLFVMGLFIYAGERKHGRVKRRVHLYERILGPPKESGND